MKVLLADDSLLMLERLQDQIKMFKQVEITGSFTNGKETLDAIRIMKPDLAIVDLKMPGLTGLQVLNEIRTENKILTFIILTFCSSDYYQNMALDAGADYFFSKVDEFDKVSLVVEKLLTNKECYIS
ncbi:MAG: response regulator transcription factor [Bacteroidales bacterium]